MKRRFLLSIVLVTICLAAAPPPVKAFDPFGSGVCSTGGASKAKQSVVCNTGNANPLSPDSQAGTQGILISITHIVAYIAGALAVIMIIASAIRFVTSGSDVSTGSRTDTDVEEAKRTIANALLGLAVIILAQAIITYAIRRL